MKKTYSNIFVIVLMFMLTMMPLALSQTDSLVVWENIADGTLICDWLETADDVWTPDNYSGLFLYNCTGKAYNVTVNSSSFGERWFQTFEVLTSDPTHGISAIQTVDVTAPTTRFYAMEYYISHAGVSPKAYIVYHLDGTNYYWNTEDDEWDDNVSNATDYSGQQEIDFYSGETFAKVKALWNWADYDTGDDMNCTARFKIWMENEDEPQHWMIDDAFSMYSGTTEQNWYAGVGANHTHAGSGTTCFRRLFFWNLSYDYDESCHVESDKIPYIGCPQASASYLFAEIEENAGEDFYNYTQAFKDAINLWDLTSFYNLNNPKNDSAQNDTIYIFSVLTTGWTDFYEYYFEEEFPYDTEFPNNILIFYIYNPTDGTIDEDDEALSWGDFCRIRFDFDNDGYDATDYTFLVDGTETLFGYQGWTQVIPDSPGYWYGVGGINDQVDDGEWGRVFRDDDYPAYTFFLNWDYISDETDAGECVNISISFYDNESGDFSVWQDWNKQNDTTPNTPASDNYTWSEVNDTTLWGIFEILGGSLDFDDAEPTLEDIVDSTTFNLLTSVLPILITVLIILFIVGFALTQGLSKESLIMLMVLCVFAVVLIQIILSL